MIDYRTARQEVIRDIDRLHPGALFLTLPQVMALYGYSDRKHAQAAIGIEPVSGFGSLRYYVGDVASDIARRRCGNCPKKAAK